MICITLSAITFCSFGQQMEIPVSQQIPLLVKVLSFNKSFQQDKKDIVVGVIYRESQPSTNSIKDTVLQFNDSTLLILANGNAVRFVPINLDRKGELEAVFAKKLFSAVYVTPVELSCIPIISNFCREHRILSMTGVAQYVEEGISVGIGMRNQKPEILINLPVSKGEGANFSSRVLQIAKIYR